MFLFIWKGVLKKLGYWHLNTSHVLIYPNQTSASRLPLAFKYISCSYLSDGSTGGVEVLC